MNKVINLRIPKLFSQSVKVTADCLHIQKHTTRRTFGNETLNISLAENRTDGRQTLISNTKTTNILSDVLHENEYLNRMYPVEKGAFMCRLFIDALNSSNFIALNISVISERWTSGSVEETDFQQRCQILANIRKGHVPIQVSVLRRGPTCFVGILLFIIHESELCKFSSMNSRLKDSFVAYAIVTLL
jgi:hypothetical protein